MHILPFCFIIVCLGGGGLSIPLFKRLKRGIDKPPPPKQTMIKQNGNICTSSEENAKVFHNHFEKIYDRAATFDPSVLDLLDQHPVIPNFDHILDDTYEIRT